MYVNHYNNDTILSYKKCAEFTCKFANSVNSV